MSRTHEEAAESPDDTRRSESGDTLIEVLIAIVILGITGVALMTGFATAISASGQHRQLATLDASVRAASDEAVAQIQSAQDGAFGTCPSTYSPSWTLPGSFTVSAYTYQYWNGTTWVTGGGSGMTANTPNCTAYGNGPQLWTMTISDSSGYATTASTVIYDPSVPTPTAGLTQSQLVFLQPTSANPGTGTVGGSLSPEPIVAIEDSAGNIVYNDASSVTLSIYSYTGGSKGTLSSSCSSVENEGVFSFSDCSLSSTGTYYLQATDSDGISSSTSTSLLAQYAISVAPPAKLVFTTASLTGAANSSPKMGAITVQEDDAFGNAVPAGSGGTVVNLSTSSVSTSNVSPGGAFAASTGGAAITAVTIPSGSTSASFYYGDTVAGTPTITAQSTGLAPATQNETITAGTATQVAIAATPTSIATSNRTSAKLGFQLEDAYGNPTTAGSGGVTLSVSSNSTKEFFSTASGGTGTLNTPVNVTFASGVGTATEYYGDESAGTWTVNALNGSNNWGSTSVTVTAGTPSTLVATSGSGQSTFVNTGFAGPLVATVTDAYGNPVAGASVTFAAPASGASGTFATCAGGNPQTYQCVATTNASGQATASTFTANTTSGGYIITPSTSGVASPPTFTATNTADSATGVTITPTPTSMAASSTTSIKLGFQLVDQYGNATTAGTGGITLSVSSTSTKEFFSTASGGTGTLNTPVNVTFASGVGTATEYYGDEAAGTWTVNALNGSNNWGSTPVTVTAKTTGDTMTVVAGNSQSTTVGNDFATPLEVLDVDQFGNPVSGASVTFAAPASGASGTFATCAGGNPQTYQCVATTNASGQATASTFTANTRSGSAYSVTTSASGVASPPTFTATNTVGAPVQVNITPTPTSMAASSTTSIALGFQLVDQYGNNTTAGTGGITLSVSSTSSKEFFSTASGGTGTLNTPVNVTFVSGVGTATEYYGDEGAGSWTVNALNGSNNWGSTPVTVTAKTTGDTMTIVAGNNQSAPTGAAFGTALEVLDVDQFGNPVPGASVTFGAPSSGASGTFATCAGGNPQTYQCVTTTNASGQATASTFTANGTAASAYSVTTSASGVASPPTFSETNRHVTATNAASGTGTGTVTTGSFNMTSGSTYVVTAFASGNNSIGTPTFTIPGSPTPTLITTNSYSNQNNCNDSSNCYQWTWWFNANTTSSTATVKLTLTGSPTGAVADVIALSGNNTSTPVVQSSTASACNSNQCNTKTTTVSANLVSTPASGDITLQILGSDDTIGTSPTWSTLNSNLYSRSAASASLNVNQASPAQQNETTSASGFSGSKDWGTTALEIGVS